jgi:TRAP-type C4-dicarboxylate transport system substrate-binding protein
VFAISLPGWVLAADAPKPDKVFVWKLQSNFPPPEKTFGYLGTYGRSMELARKVKERTNGGLDIKVFTPGTLFKEFEALDAVKKGSIEMIASTGSYHVGLLPEALLEWGLPYCLQTTEQAAKLHLKTDYLKLMRQAYEKHNMYLVGIFSTSSYNYITRFPVRNLADLKGKMIRGSGMSAKIAAAHGATPTNITGAEQYMALQRGTIDGTLYPPYTGLSYKLFEVVKYISWPSIYAASTDDLIINLDAWKKLPPAYQAILQEEADKLREYSFEVSGPALEKVARDEGKKKYGVESIYMSNAEFAKFQNAVTPLWREWGSKSELCGKLVKLSKETGGITW